VARLADPIHFNKLDVIVWRLRIAYSVVSAIALARIRARMRGSGMSDEPLLQPEKTRRVSVPRKYPRSIAPRTIADGSNVADSAVRWLIPWTSNDYPGIGRGIEQMTGIPRSSWKHYRYARRRLSKRAASILANVIESRVAAAVLILAELREVERTYVDRRTIPSGWQVVRERGGLVTDGRPKRSRRKG